MLSALKSVARRPYALSLLLPARTRSICREAGEMASNEEEVVVSRARALTMALGAVSVAIEEVAF